MSSLNSVGIDATDDCTISVTTNDATNKTLTISASNSGAGEGNVSISGDNVDVETFRFTGNQIAVTGSDTSMNFLTTGTGTFNFLATGSNQTKLVLYEDNDMEVIQ